MLIYRLIRFLGVSWITYWHPLLIVVLLVSYIGLSIYFRQKILNEFKRVIEENFNNVVEISESFKHFSDACVFDDIKGRVSGKFMFSAFTFLLSYYILLVFAISVADHYTIYYGGPPILTVLFDTYATYTWSVLISILLVSTYLAYIGYAEGEKDHRDAFSEWVEGLMEDYVVNNCLRYIGRSIPSRILMVIVPLIPIPKKELLRFISIPPLPRTLAEVRLNAVGSSKSYSIEPLNSLRRGEKAMLSEALIPKEGEVITIKDLEKGILQNVRVAKIYENSGNKKEFLGYLITFTEKLEAARVIITRQARGGRFWCKPDEAVTHIYLLALHPRIVKFYMDLWLLNPKKKNRILTM